MSGHRRTEDESDPNRVSPTDPTYGAPPLWMRPVSADVTPSSAGAFSLNPRARPFVPQPFAAASSGAQSAYNFLPSSLGSQLRRPVVLDDGDDTTSLRERLVIQLEQETYECMICCHPIFVRQGLWSCERCYAMFHFHPRHADKSCITKWAQRSEAESKGGWRCPGCQNITGDLPTSYTCFCRRTENPRFDQFRMGDVTPHSCGETCGRVRGVGCPHRCTLPCHPGPCPDCPRMINKRCLCGSQQKTLRCGSCAQFQCDKVCGRTLNCGVHKCEIVCHADQCAPCQEKTLLKCFCGRHAREVLCQGEATTNGYSCGALCAKSLYCDGGHECSRVCHDGDCGACPGLPEQTTRCPCGKSKLSELTPTPLPRKSCSDAVPTCAKICSKLLPCGNKDKPHECSAKCHEGDCPPCLLTTPQRCRCGANTQSINCIDLPLYQGEYGNGLQCERRCKKMKSCRMHKCQERCCVDGDHICTQICGKRLSCTLHNCDRLCHVGACGTCLQASFDELRCLCGATMVEPPIPCGTPLPMCNWLCSRQHNCQHPVTHNCHGDPQCPPCTHLTKKMCYGGHELRRNIPCYLNDVSCGRPCEKPVDCGGGHNCNRICHPGDCLPTDEVCKQPCTVIRAECDHPCMLPCHGANECPSSRCTYGVYVTCQCGRRHAKHQCYDVHRMWERYSAITALDHTGNSAASSETNVDKYKCLQCDEDCAKVIRNKKLASALNLDKVSFLPVLTNDPVYTEFLKSQCKSNASAVLNVERAFLKLIDETEQLKHSKSKSHVFPPMNKDHRRVAHEYAPYFRIETVSYDPEPQRNVVATAIRGVSKAPTFLLSKLIEQRNVGGRVAPPPPKNSWGLAVGGHEDVASSCTSSSEPRVGMQTIGNSQQLYSRRSPPLVLKNQHH